MHHLLLAPDQPLTPMRRSAREPSAGQHCEGMQTSQPEREGVLGSSSEECWPGAA